MKRFMFYSRFETGHRLEYIKFCEDQLEGERVSGWSLLWSSKPLLFLMIEESFLSYVFVGIVRSLFGRRTVGLVFRAKECVQRDSLRLNLKYFVLQILKCIKGVKSVSIVPFSVCPETERICDDWIHDFQYWDLAFLMKRIDTELANNFALKLKESADGRKILCAIGRQDISKGFDQFIKLYTSSEKIREEYFFVAGGEISGLDKELVNKFIELGGKVIDRRITDDELVALYMASDIVWAVYSPLYDQSSGVLGRALQFNKTVVVRKGSIVEELACSMGGGVISLAYPIENAFYENIDLLLLSKISSSFDIKVKKLDFI